ncbi:transcriptional regulator [Streptomyces sp. NPDC127063]|uniref:transcriptional regulator n=1 Tax=Streptomyces sp. NPDC127063 TaxID=3347123 RepID=UPI0036599F70
MPERNMQFGLYGARGIKGHEAVARQLDALAGFIATPITARRGLLARLHYLTRSDRALAAARAAGLTATPRTIRAWLAGTRAPSKKNLERIEQAYRTVRRQNVARHLLARLNRGGRGTRVEFHPLNQSQVSRPRQRELSFRTLNVRRWDRIVAAWAADDDQALDDAWVSDAVVDLGSEWGQYEFVTNIGFAA